MARIIWKENKVIEIELRTGLFVLAQMHANPYLIFYNIFRKDDDWGTVDLNATPVLFYAPVTRQFLASSNLATRKDIKPLLNYSPPVCRIKMDPLAHREITFWSGTANEITVSVLGEGGGELFEKKGNDIKTLMHSIPFDDTDTIDSYELTNIRMYAELCERLYLCYKFQRNVDPLKALVFNQEMPKEYRVYLQIINGSITKEEWLALPL